MIKILHNGTEYELDIDVQEELEEFDWKHKKVVFPEFHACSPFRDERRPSFSINLETGLYIDFGSDDDNFKKGNIVGLLSFLHNITYEETKEYLIEKYGGFITEVEGLELKIDLKMEEKKERKFFTRDELKPYLFREKSYLLSRGISEEIQKKFFIGYDRTSRSIAFFWLDEKTGKVINVKFRSTRGKQFYYISGGEPVRNHIFGLWQVIQEYEEGEPVYIVESEIDALFLWSNGIKAVALGGSHFSPEQKKKLVLSGISKLVIATDSDKAGRRIRNELVSELIGVIDLEEIKLPSYAKDVNEVKPEHIKKVTDSSEPITLNVPLRIA